MIITGRHLDSLRYPIAALALIAVVGAGVVAWSRVQIVTDQAALAAQEGQLREARKPSCVSWGRTMIFAAAA